MDNDPSAQTGDEPAQYGDLLDYFQRPAEIEDVTFTQFYEVWYKVRICRSLRIDNCLVDSRGQIWKRRQASNVMLARMPWVAKSTGELFYLRKLLLVFPARSYDDLYRGYRTFKESAAAAGLIPPSDEVLHTMLDAIQERYSSASCRRFFVMMILHTDQADGVLTAYENPIVQNYLMYDFLPAASRNEEWDDQQDVARSLLLCDLVMIAFSMNSRVNLSQTYGLPPAPNSESEVLWLIQHVGPHNRTLCDYMEHVSMRVVPGDEYVVHRVHDFESEVRQHFASVEAELGVDMGSESLLPLNEEQQPLFDVITGSLNSTYNPRLFNIDAPAGCGKTFLCRRLLRYADSLGIIALPCATTGIAALQYPRGSTVHSLFDIPPYEDLQVMDGPSLESRLIEKLQRGRSTARICLLRKLTVLIWDEIAMASKTLFEAVDRVLRAVMGMNVPFGGKLVVLVGDFRQVTAVCPAATVQRQMASPLEAFATSAFFNCVKSSDTWRQFRILHLTTNVRAIEDVSYHNLTLEVGNGTIGEVTGVLDVNTLGFRLFHELDRALQWVYEDPIHSSYDPVLSSKRAIIAPFNREVDEVNKEAEDRFRTLYPVTELYTMLSYDHLENDDDLEPPVLPSDHNDEAQQLAREQADRMNEVEMQDRRRLRDDDELPPEVDDLTGMSGAPFDISEINNQRLDHETFCDEILHSMSAPGVPPHSIKLWRGSSCVLLRNLDPKNKLLNGKRVTVRSVSRSGRLLSVCHAEDAAEECPLEFLIPRINFPFRVGGQDASIVRKQFPIRLAYGITIHKSQGSTLDRVVVDLRCGCFEHGQLYVALSRVRGFAHIAILIQEGQMHIVNIVHAILLDIMRSANN